MQRALSRKVKYRLLISGLVLLSILCIRLYYRLTDDFRIYNIQFELPYHPEWEIPPPSQEEQLEINHALSQKFYYLGKGAQSYAFKSADNNYVLKFFKFKHLRPFWLIELLPDVSFLSQYKQQVSSRKSKKLFEMFNGYRLAYAVHRPESGLIYIQFNPPSQERIITVVDKIGFEHRIDLGSTNFILQKKCTTFRNHLAELIQKEELSTAKQRIHQIFDLYLSEYAKGIYDHDHGVMHNTGFTQTGTPIHLDVGKMYSDERIQKPEVYRKDLLKMALRMALWIRSHHPEVAQELLQEVEKRLSIINEQDYYIPANITYDMVH